MFLSSFAHLGRRGVQQKKTKIHKKGKRAPMPAAPYNINKVQIEQDETIYKLKINI